MIAGPKLGATSFSLGLSLGTYPSHPSPLLCYSIPASFCAGPQKDQWGKENLVSHTDCHSLLPPSQSSDLNSKLIILTHPI